MTPEMILAIATAVEMFTRNLLRDIDAMTEEEQDKFILEQKARKADHDAWLRDRVGK